MWNTAKSWWNSASGAVTDWWNNGDKTVVAVSTATIGWGAIPTVAVTEGVYEFSDQILTIWILN